MEKLLEKLKTKLSNLENLRERNVNRFILPVETKINKVKERIRQLEK